MCVIPKGDHQGQVLVFDEFPVRVTPSTAVDPSGDEWTCQAWAIVNTSVSGDTAQFWNFLLPMRRLNPVDESAIDVIQLFCAGHCWTPNGDLIVSGGTEAQIDNTGFPPIIANPGLSGAVRQYLFDPAATSQTFGSLGNLYGALPGHWQRGRDLFQDRFYPTTTLSWTLTRAIPNTPLVMVSGGSDANGPNDPRNTYSTMKANTILSAFAVDYDPDPALHAPQPGPSPTGTGTPLPNERLNEYPRIVQLSDGQHFNSGPSPQGSKVDLNDPTVNRTWDRTIGRTGLSWNDQREYGSTVFFSTLGGLSDVVARFGGRRVVGTTAQATNSAEFCLAATAGSGWTSIGPMPGPGRAHLNAVILPDASVLVLGGTQYDSNGNASPVLSTHLFRPGIGWAAQPDSPSTRQYHSTAVLLPDGRVLVGGGEGPIPGDTDYDVFLPHYLVNPSDSTAPPPLRPMIANITGTGVSVDPDDGTFVISRSQIPPTGLTLTCNQVQDLNPLDHIVLMAPGATTHHSDMHARYVPVPSVLVANTSDQVLFVLPDSKRLPLGYYMLFALNVGGIPSEAVFVKVEP